MSDDNDIHMIASLLAVISGSASRHWQFVFK